MKKTDFLYNCQFYLQMIFSCIAITECFYWNKGIVNLNPLTIEVYQIPPLTRAINDDFLEEKKCSYEILVL